MNTLLSSNSSNVFGGWYWVILLITIFWVLPWKCYALWTAAKRGEKIWFVAILILNTVGILEIIYVFVIAKKKWSEINQAFLGLFPSKNKTI